MKKTALVKIIVLLCLIASTSVTGVVHGQPATRFFAETGFAVSDDGQTAFLSEFQRLGGVDGLGYPVSVPYQLDGFHYQAFQRAILQWRPERGRAVLANTFDWLSGQGKDSWLDSLGIPEPLADRGGNWGQVVAEREGWLIEPAIARAYRSAGGLERFGLPQSRPERRGPFIVQRFQRVALQLWLDQGSGTPAPGTVVGILAGEMASQAGIIPAQAMIPSQAGGSDVAGDSQYALIVPSPEAEGLALTLINQARAGYGLPPVVMDDALRRVARAHAVDMASRDFFAHTSPEGLEFTDRLRAAGINNWTVALENVARGDGYGSPSDAARAFHEMMMAEKPGSDGHKRNIIDGQVRRVGIGVVQRVRDGRVYFVSNYTD